MSYVEKFWHNTLRRPYRLRQQIDVGSGQPVVFLHGIAARADTWTEVVDELDSTRFRGLAFDLLGFGDSPRPDWLDYSVNDHARAVARSIKRARPGTPVILVGHSMGAVIAARVARLYPKLVKHLILYQVPVYSDNPEVGIRDIRNKAYLRFLDSLADNQKSTLRKARVLERIARSAVQFTLSEDNWPAFEKSIRNTVMQEDVYEDIQQLNISTDIVYGTYDPIVLRRGMRKAFKGSELVNFHRTTETHRISPKAGKIIIGLIESVGLDKAHKS